MIINKKNVMTVISHRKTLILVESFCNGYFITDLL